MKRPAVFFDRDKTLIEDPGYISRPEQVKPFEDAAEAIARLRRAGYLIVVVSNQSGVARGLITEEQVARVHRRLEELLERRGARIDAIYFCPYLDGPDATVEAYRRDSDLRKPAPGMLLQAARDLQIDLERSWLIGDRARDIEAGCRSGCRTILLERQGTATAAHSAGATHVADSLSEAADMILEEDADRSGADTPASSENPSGPTPPPRQQTEETSARLLQVLTEIRDLLDRSTRRRRQEDFSLLRLGGTLLQMLAVVAAVWGLLALFSDNNAAAIARFTVAIFLQLATLTLQLGNRRD